MPTQQLQLIVTQAVVDREFCALLLTDPVGACADYGLSPAERSLLDSIEAETLEQFAAQLCEGVGRGRVYPARRVRRMAS